MAAESTLAEASRDVHGLADLLELENDPGFLELVCPDTGVLAWPAIRSEVFRLVLGDRLFSTPLIDFAQHRDPRGLIGGAVRAAVHNLSHPAAPSEVLFLATGAGLVSRGGRTFNRYVDYFSDRLATRAWTVESLYGGRWPDEPRSNQRLSFLADHRLALAVRSRVSTRAIHRRLARELVGLVERQGRDRLGWELGKARRERLIAVAARRIAAYPITQRFASGLIRRIRPRLAIVEEGCYGHMAVFNATAREHGVHVAEFQHGMVTPSHDAYNVSPFLASSPAYRTTQPGSFLAYGAWWTGQFNAPVDRKVVIGNPHRTESLRSWQPSPDRSTLIVLGDGVDTEAYLALAAQLKAAVSQYDVRFRPHPLERASVMASATNAVVIDESPDLYASLGTAVAVIGETSTALFEAIGIVPRVFVWDTPKSRFYLGDHPFERFADVEELAAMVAVPRAATQLPADDVWAEGWDQRFQRFVEEQVG